jgi:hypothetical protein
MDSIAEDLVTDIDWIRTIMGSMLLVNWAFMFSLMSLTLTKETYGV